MKKKLLFINGHLNVGGVEKSLTDLLVHLDYSKFDVDLLLLEDLGDYTMQIPQQVNIIFFDTTKSYGPLLSVLFHSMVNRDWSTIVYRLITLASNRISKKANLFLRGLLKLNHIYDVAIAYRVGYCAELVAYMVRAKRKLVWWHHGEIKESKETIADYNKIWENIDSLVCVSNGCKDMLAHTFKYSTKRMVVIPNMVDMGKILNAAGEVSPYPSGDKINIVSVGRLCTEKHFEDAIITARNLLDRRMDNFHWYIIGDGELYNELMVLIRDLRVGDFVTLLGKKTNPYPWIKFADIFVHPSYVESQGLTILEAMALKTPCVVSRSIGSSEFMLDEMNGIITENNPDSLCEGVLKMIDADNIDIYRKNGMCTVKLKYTPSVIISSFENLVLVSDDVV